MMLEGVSYDINWRKFRRGSSIFLLCLDAETARVSVAEVFRRLQMKVLIVMEVEEGVRGLRIWRL